MKKFWLVLIIGILLNTSYISARFIATYYAKLGVMDHFNSRGKRLTSAAAIIRQDRYNFHVRGIRDPQDTWDPFFDSKRNRAILESLLRRGNATWSALNAIVSGTPIIKVNIYSDHINVKVIRNRPLSTIE